MIWPALISGFFTCLFIFLILSSDLLKVFPSLASFMMDQGNINNSQISSHSQTDIQIELQDLENRVKKIEDQATTSANFMTYMEGSVYILLLSLSAIFFSTFVREIAEKLKAQLTAGKKVV